MDKVVHYLNRRPCSFVFIKLCTSVRYVYMDKVVHCVNRLSFRYVLSWIDTRELQSERANLTILFDKYVPTCLDVLRNRFKKITPIVEISHVQMLCHLLECLLTETNTPPDCPKELYELYFVFSCVWAFGSCMFQDQVSQFFQRRNCSSTRHLGEF